jgi:hypothetical protein
MMKVWYFLSTVMIVRFFLKISRGIDTEISVLFARDEIPHVPNMGLARKYLFLESMNIFTAKEYRVILEYK